MAFLVDTNLLLRSVEPTHPMYGDASNAIATLLGQGEQLHIVPQNLIEFWNVYTRPAQKNGLGHTLAEAEVEINRCSPNSHNALAIKGYRFGIGNG